MNDVISSPGFLGLAYFILAALATLLVDVLRRYVKRRLEIWEAEHPIPNNKKTSSKGGGHGDDEENEEDFFN